MSDFHIRSESVDVEQIMKQIRARIREKRGVDYTEDQIRELATVRLEKFLDAKNLRSDLLEQFRRSRPAIPSDPQPIAPPYEFSDETLFASHRGPLRIMRKMLKPLLKLFFNPNTLNQVLHAQAQFNADLLKREQRRRIEFEKSRAEWNALYYEVLHNLVLETTRNAIELKNMKMRLEALAGRLDFSERRVRALEGVVQYRPEVVHRERDRDRERERDRDRDRDRGSRGHDDRARAGHDTSRVERAARPADQPAADVADPLAVPTGEGAPVQPGTGEASGRRRRRRRRGRRGAGAGAAAGAPGAASAPGNEGALDADNDADEAFEGADDGPAPDEPESSAPVEPNSSSEPDQQ